MPIEVSLLAAAVVAALVIGVDAEPREAASAEAVVDMAVSGCNNSVRCVLVPATARGKQTIFEI